MGIGEFPDDAKTKLCVACGALMPTLASKCTKCDSYQNWYQKISVSTNVLALLTALISVSAATLPNLWSWIRSGHSRLEVDFAHDDAEGGIFFNVTNFGDRTGTLIEVKVQFEVPSKHFSYQASIDPDSNPTVEAGKSGKLRYTIEIGQDLREYKVGDVKGSCTILIAMRDINGVKNSTINRDCRDIRPLDFMR